LFYYILSLTKASYCQISVKIATVLLYLTHCKRMMYLSKIIEVVQANMLGSSENPVISHLLTDSRKSSHPSSTLFIAIKGERHDGHHYIPKLIERGFRYFLVSNSYALSSLDKRGVYIFVDDTLAALQLLAAYKRSLFQSAVVSITGSNGKTIVKEWLYYILSEKYAIVKSPKSYNSQLGVALSLWPLDHQHHAGIFEAGISEMGEMEKLEKMISPTHGIITNIGSAHDEGFESREQKVKEKLTLFKNSKYVIYRKDHRLIHEHIIKNNYSFKAISWATDSTETDFHVTYHVKKSTTHISLWKESVSWNFQVPFIDKASLENITHCIVLCLQGGQRFQVLQERLSSLQAVDMRMALIQGINQCHLVNDVYNNDLVGLKMALDFASQQFIDKKHSLILSDFLETGSHKKDFLAELEILLNEYKLNKVIGIGPVLSQQDFVDHGWESTADLLKSNSLSTLFDEELILIKGARAFQFEKIVAALIQKKHQTELKIDLDAIAHNLNYYRAKLHPSTKVLAMVKAFGYGSGSHEVAQLLQYQQIDYLGVAYVDEGVSLRKAGVHTDILVLNSSEHEFDRLIEYKLDPEVYSLKQLASLIAYTNKLKKNINVHIKLDTGMHRLGFLEHEIDEMLSLLHYGHYVNIVGVFSHLASAESKEDEAFSQQQIQLFGVVSEKIERTLNKKIVKHILNTSGISRFLEAQFDMVRIGIGMYGISSTHTEQKHLQVVGHLHSMISQIKLLKKGETVGYNRKGKITKEVQKIGIIPIGYADGYDRRFGNGIGKVMINGTVVPTIGAICMDMCMIDLTGVDVKDGDLVELFGDNISLHQLAEAIGTIPYELLTNISQRVVRVFVAN